MRRPSGVGLRDVAARLGCTTAELLALAILSAGAVGMMAMLWWLQRPMAAPAESSIAAALGHGVEPSPSRSPGWPASVRSPEAAPASSATVRVHVAGRVLTPGVYELGGDARVVDAVAAAGGPTAEADLEAVNLAQPLSDGLQIRVPAPGESISPVVPAVTPGSTVEASAVVDLNTAGAAALETLPGVGPVTAERILEHRARLGGFSSVEELLDISGIGEATLSGIADRVTVGP